MMHLLPVFRRPYYDEFLDFCAQNYEVAIWSSRNKYDVTPQKKNTTILWRITTLQHKNLTEYAEAT